MRSTPETEAFVDRLISEGRILATDRSRAIAMLEHSARLEEKIILDDGARLSPLELLKRVLSNLTPQEAGAKLAAYAEITSREEKISFREAFLREGSLRPELVREYFRHKFSARGSGTKSDSPPERLNRLAEEKARKEGVSFAEAFRCVQLEDPALARAYIDFYRS